MVSFGEDGNRTRKGHGQENLGKVRRLARALLGKAKGKRNDPKLDVSVGPRSRRTHKSRRANHQRNSLMRQPCDCDSVATFALSLSFRIIAESRDFFLEAALRCTIRLELA